MTTLYEILEVSETASPEAIRAAYRRLARTHHPDRGGSAAAFQAIESAHSTLIDPAKRTAYDEERAACDAGSTGDSDSNHDVPEEPPPPTWGTERTVDPEERPRRRASSFEDRSDPLPDSVRNWSAPPLPAPPGKPHRSRTVSVIGMVGLGAYLAVLATYVITALSPLDVAGLPVAVTFLAVACLQRALSSRSGAWSLIVEILLAAPAVASVAGVLDAPLGALRDPDANPAADLTPAVAGILALVVVTAMILATELWRADGRRAHARTASAWAAYQQACRTKELAEHWQQMLLKSALPDLQLWWVVNTSPTGPKTNALLEDPRTGHRANRWLWERWDPGIWMVVNDRTGEVVHWAAAEARDAWDLIGPRA